MNYKTLKISALAIGAMFLTSCSSSQSNQGQNGGQGQRGGGAPSATQLIAEMDTDNDGQLSKNEVKGPLANDFSTVDSNSDGYLSKEELENAPKPQGGGQKGGGQRR